MLDRIRRLHISLAAKCQLLFGAALVLIIAAALFVPWQRMEQLTAQLNDTAAEAIAETIIRQHVQTAAVPTPELMAARAAAPPTTRPGRGNVPESLPPRLIGLRPWPSEQLTPWEGSVLKELRGGSPTRLFDRIYTRHDGNDGFRYARAVTLEKECIRCHGSNIEIGGFDPTLLRSRAMLSTTAASLPTSNATSNPASNPASNPVTETVAENPRVLGFVSVDIASQVRLNQHLLNRIFMLTAGLLAGTLAIVVFSVIVTRLILQPVRVLQETAEKSAAGISTSAPTSTPVMNSSSCRRRSTRCWPT